MSNKSVVFVKPFHVEVKDKEYPSLDMHGRKCEDGVLLKIILSGICGSDLHMYRGRSKIEVGRTLGHEITGQIIECGAEVKSLKKGDLVSVPFNVACGFCINCKELKVNACLSVNPEQPGGAWGYSHMGRWEGGQAEYLMVPFADFNLLKLPDFEICKDKLLDLALITDVFPTGYHAAYHAGVTIGDKVYIAGAGPIGLACALSCKMLGAAVIMVGDVNTERLKKVRENGYHPIDLSTSKDLSGQIRKNIGQEVVDIFIDAVGFEAYGYGDQKDESLPTTVLESAFKITRTGGTISIPGVYTNEDLGGKTPQEKKGIYELSFGDCWNKGLRLVMGQTPVIKYNRRLMEDILHERCSIAQELNVKRISLQEAPRAYEEFNKGRCVKYFIDPHGMLD